MAHMFAVNYNKHRYVLSKVCALFCMKLFSDDLLTYTLVSGKIGMFKCYYARSCIVYFNQKWFSHKGIFLHLRKAFDKVNQYGSNLKQLNSRVCSVLLNVIKGEKVTSVSLPGNSFSFYSTGLDKI